MKKSTTESLGIIIFFPKNNTDISEKIYISDDCCDRLFLIFASSNVFYKLFFFLFCQSKTTSSVCTRVTLFEL